MFSKNKAKKAASSTSTAKIAAPSIISSDLRIIGDISSDGEIQVDGNIEGDIRTGSLLVGETAVIKGEIVADSVYVHGMVNGQIKARLVDLAKTSHVTGDILHEDLSIEAGAFLEGLCKRIPPKKDITQDRAKAGTVDNTVNIVIKEPNATNVASKNSSKIVPKAVAGS